MLLAGDCGEGGGGLPPVLVLFDIDGTLLEGGGSGTLAMRRAFAAAFGVVSDGVSVATAGRTDLAIFADMAAVLGVSLDADAEARLIAAYLQVLPQAMAECGARLLPGVRPLVEALAADPRCRLAVGTGNLAAGAAIKLRHLGVDRLFPIGGFGDRQTDRAALIAGALAAARRHYGVAFAPTRTVVVGDAPPDIAAARANGMRVLSVATGRTEAAVLAAMRPDALVPDLGDTARIHSWLVGSAEREGESVWEWCGEEG